MTAMRFPELLDRRSLALLRLVDVNGRAVAGPVRLLGEGISYVRKNDGTIAILSAGGLEAYQASFLAPSSPAIGSRPIQLDLEPGSNEVCRRRIELQLPRDPNPSKADKPNSLFRSIEFEMLPGPTARLVGSACALRVTVRRKNRNQLVQNALVRARTDDGQLTARGLTDARGEATLIFPTLPIAFAGAGANLHPEIEARVAVSVDEDLARFNAPSAIPPARSSAAPFVDPDKLGSTAADFASGVPVTIGAGREVACEIQWTKP